MPILNDKLLKAVKGRLPKEGFRKTFWQANRARAANGSGVGKVLETMASYGVSAGGSAEGVEAEFLGRVVSLYDTLSKCIKAAKGKCGKSQSHTIEMCDTYLKLIPKLKSDAEKRLAGAAKADGAAAAENQAQAKAAAEKERNDKALAAFVKAANPIAKDIRQALKLAGECHAAANAANGEIAKIHSKWMSECKPGSGNAAALTKAALTSIENAGKSHKLEKVRQAVYKMAENAKVMNTTIQSLNVPAGAERDHKALGENLKQMGQKVKLASSATASAIKTYNYVVAEMKTSEAEGV